MLKIFINKILIIISALIGFSCLLIMPDYEEPVVEILWPTPNIVVFENVEIICKIEDNSNLSHAELWVNNESDSESGIPDFNNLQDEYKIYWNTTYIENGIYYLQVMAYDENGNIGKSEEISIYVDNSNSFPGASPIISVELIGQVYKITWKKTGATDFKKYKLQHLNPWIDIFHFNEVDVYSTENINDTVFYRSGIDATLIDNYYRVKVYDTFGFVTPSSPIYVAPDPHPNEIEINSAEYDNNSIIINWDQSIDFDFDRYELYESYDEEMEEENLIFSSENIEATEYVREGIYDNETRYYRINIFDIWGQKTNGPILVANAFTRFYNAYGGTDDEEGLHVIPIRENGFIVTGYTKSFGAGNKDGFVMQLDLEGNQLSKTTYGGSNLDVIEDAIMLADSSIMFVGRTESSDANGTDGWVLHTDQNSILISENNYGGPGTDRFNSIIQNNNGSLAAVGYKSIHNENSTDIDIWLAEIDQFGILTNEFTFGGNNFDYGKDLYPLSIGGYLLLGETLSYGSGGFDIYLLKILANGELDWSTTLAGTTSNESAKKLIFDRSGGGFYILMKEGGNSSNPVSIIKVDLFGNELWRQNYGYTLNDNGADMVDIGLSSDVLLVFGTTYINGNGDLWFFKVDVNTGELFDENIFSDGNGDDHGYGIDVVADDGGYILVGETSSYGSGGKDIIAIKTDPYGNTVGFESE